MPLRRYLIVANETILGEPLVGEVRRRVAGTGAGDGGCELHLVVPASHGHGTWTEGQARAAAAKRLEEAIERFGDLGANAVTGEVGDVSPVLAVGDAIIGAHHGGQAPFDEVIVSTLPLGVSRWVKQDVVHRLQRAHPTLTITHVVSAPVLA